MSILTILTLVAVFGAVGLLTFAIATLLASPSDSARRRLSTIVQQQTTSLLISKTATLADESDQAAERILNALPNSYGSVKRLRRELALGGFYTTRAAAIFAGSIRPSNARNLRRAFGAEPYDCREAPLKRNRRRVQTAIRPSRARIFLPSSSDLGENEIGTSWIRIPRRISFAVIS